MKQINPKIHNIRYFEFLETVHNAKVKYKLQQQIKFKNLLKIFFFWKNKENIFTELNGISYSLITGVYNLMLSYLFLWLNINICRIS